MHAVLYLRFLTINQMNVYRTTNKILLVDMITKLNKNSV
jgi:hypothetical protein